MQQEADTGSEHVIVVGAGLAGLAVALRLHRYMYIGFDFVSRVAKSASCG